MVAAITSLVVPGNQRHFGAKVAARILSFYCLNFCRRSNQKKCYKHVALEWSLEKEDIFSKTIFTKEKYTNAKRSIPAHPTFVNDTHHDLHLWTVTSKLIGFTIVNMSAKFDKEIHNGLVSCSHAYFHICPLWPWPLTFKINRVHPLTMPNMSAKFDQEAHNGLVSIVFTSLFPYMSIVTLTFDLLPPKSIGFILSPCPTCLPSLIKKHTTV